MMNWILLFAVSNKTLTSARRRGVHHFALAADALDQFVFDESVNIFGAFDGQAAFFDVGDDVDEGIADQFRVVLGNDLRFAQHFYVRDARENIVPVQLIVERQRLVKLVRALRARFGESSFPQFHDLYLRFRFKSKSFDLFRGKL